MTIRPHTSGGTVLCSLMHQACLAAHVILVHANYTYSFSSIPIQYYMACRPFCPALKHALVLQCTSGRPFVRRRAGRMRFFVPSGIQTATFYELTSFLPRTIRKGCVSLRPVLLSFSIASCNRGRGILCLIGTIV